MIYFSSELIAKSIWSGEKTSPKLAMKSRGIEEAFHLCQHSLDRPGRGKMLPHLVYRRSNLPRSGEGTQCSRPSYYPFIIFSHPFRQSSLSLFQEPIKDIKCRLSNLSVHKKHLESLLKMQMLPGQCGSVN